jgi:uncharacterized membrane protein YcaP (DUF421 family)
MMEIGKILVRVVFTYVVMLILLRLSGKRVISESTSFDFVLAIIIGDLFDDLFWAEVPASQFLVAAGTLMLLELSVTLGAYANRRFARLVNFSPEEVVRDGEPVRRGLRRERLNERDVKAMLRQQAGLERERWDEVALAIVEPGGELAVKRHEWARETQKKDVERLKVEE